jgi:hypothetical protein
MGNHLNQERRNEVIGRKSGRVISFPLVMTVDGQRYLASMLGDNTQWVRNVRASGGKAVLRHGGRKKLDEIPFFACETGTIDRCWT